MFINGKNLIIVNGNSAFNGLGNYFKITQVIDDNNEDYAEAWIFYSFDGVNVKTERYYTIELEVNSGGGEPQ